MNLLHSAVCLEVIVFECICIFKVKAIMTERDWNLTRTYVNLV